MATDTQRGIQNVCLMILAAVAVGFVLVWFRSVLIPFVLAVFFAYGLAPVIEFQTSRFRVPRSLAVLITLLLGIFLLSLAGGLISTSIQQLSENADSYQTQIEQTVERVLDSPLVARLAPGFADELNFREIVPTRQLGAVLVGTTGGDELGLVPMEVAGFEGGAVYHQAVLSKSRKVVLPLFLAFFEARAAAANA